MTDDEKALTYEEAKQLCRMAFDAGADYVRTSLQYHCKPKDEDDAIIAEYAAKLRLAEMEDA